MIRILKQNVQSATALSLMVGSCVFASEALAIDVLFAEMEDFRGQTRR